MKNIPTIPHEKKTEAPTNAKILYWMPTDTPYGNFSLTRLKISHQIDYVNLQIQKAFQKYDLIQSHVTAQSPFNIEYEITNEIIIHMIKKIADELTSIIHCLYLYEQKRDYPQSLSIDCIGKLINKIDQSVDFFKKHIDILDSINNLCNAHKHSLVNSNQSHIGRDEPCVFAFYMPHNQSSSDTEFMVMRISELIDRFDKFYQDCDSWLCDFSKRHLPRNSAKIGK